MDTRIKATVASTMYDMTRVNAKGYFDSEEARYAAKQALNAQRIKDYRSGEYELGGGVIDPLPEDAPFFVKDYHSYYKTPRGYHKRSLNSNGGRNKTSSLSFINMPILAYSNEIRSAVMVIHGDNKELPVIEGAVHTDLYDGGDSSAIPFDKPADFYNRYMGK